MGTEEVKDGVKLNNLSGSSWKMKKLFFLSFLLPIPIILICRANPLPPPVLVVLQPSCMDTRKTTKCFMRLPHQIIHYRARNHVQSFVCLRKQKVLIFLSIYCILTRVCLYYCSYKFPFSSPLKWFEFTAGEEFIFFIFSPFNKLWKMIVATRELIIHLLIMFIFLTVGSRICTITMRLLMLVDSSKYHHHWNTGI